MQSFKEIAKIMTNTRGYSLGFSPCKKWLRNHPNFCYIKKILRCIFNTLFHQLLGLDDDRLSIASSSYTTMSRRSNKYSVAPPVCVPAIQDKSFIKRYRYAVTTMHTCTFTLLYRRLFCWYKFLQVLIAFCSHFSQCNMPHFAQASRRCLFREVRAQQSMQCTCRQQDFLITMHL